MIGSTRNRLGVLNMAKDQIPFFGDKTQHDAAETQASQPNWDSARHAAYSADDDPFLKDHGRHGKGSATNYAELGIGTSLIAAGAFSLLRIQNPIAKVAGAA